MHVNTRYTALQSVNFAGEFSSMKTAVAMQDTSPQIDTHVHTHTHTHTHTQAECGEAEGSGGSRRTALWQTEARANYHHIRGSPGMPLHNRLVNHNGLGSESRNAMHSYRRIMYSAS